ncbi:hypothetical protein E2C01_078028 [Portunus trituberculatus]|uniref:Uncharacterized protein n=1 Tax=Portunus trituberculatus TaxID=210409 RepID=A0A5B7IFX5_PORTR|nr:hypothetical protein [Portunus trituberculatus]
MSGAAQPSTCLITTVVRRGVRRGRGGGEVANEVTSGGEDGSGVCYGRAVTPFLALNLSSHVKEKKKKMKSTHNSVSA